ncbi:beta-defensin 112 [Mirounga angustirostris]|uniref:Beta-defensin n=1 Tax=Neomonachus schauinslandi TaxID=29088 RepID=A0A8M1MKH8_NEOSC|nr:beta-defensin 112 [Mirounga leonina]XP_035949456.1 beta-defensin 112 [Halichoerus grypus]XP_044773153.1 beta-defensin 112 [Neomonachus schauinslandi]XP_045722139.1 beta-defensin 112 [Mirounga angustirostris]
MKILLSFSILSFGVFIPPARSKEHYAVFNWWEACIKLSGQCKNQCGEKEFKMAYCARPTTLCCMRQCDHIE